MTDIPFKIKWNNQPFESVWRCPDCAWIHFAHPAYGWAAHDTKAVEVHQTMLCPKKEVNDD